MPTKYNFCVKNIGKLILRFQLSLRLTRKKLVLLVSVDFLSEVSCAKSNYFDPINTLNYLPLLMGHPI